MSDAVIVSLISLGGTLAGTLLGILTSTKLTNYRLEQLEKRVNVHNNHIERLYGVEKKIAVMEEEFTAVNRRIGKLEKGER